MQLFSGEVKGEVCSAKQQPEQEEAEDEEEAEVVEEEGEEEERETEVVEEEEGEAEEEVYGAVPLHVDDSCIDESEVDIKVRLNKYI